MKSKILIVLVIFMSVMSFMSCNKGGGLYTPEMKEFNYKVDKFADVEILRYRVPGVELLTPQQQEMLYYLTEAALWGRDIIYDQNFKYNLVIRKTLEEIYKGIEEGNMTPDCSALEVYLKRVWLSNGIHHHYAGDKFVPGFSQEFFENSVRKLNAEQLPLREGQTVEEFIAEISPVIFDSTLYARNVVTEVGVDLIANSSMNYYEGVTQAEAEAFYAAMKDPADTEPISYGLNSQLVKENGVLVEKVYKVGGKYSAALEKVVENLEKAKNVAESTQQAEMIQKLIDFNRSGNLKEFDEYAVLWTNDTEPQIDFVNGFTETYGDPLGLKAAWESLINFKNIEATKRTEAISDNAQWFEDNSPIAAIYKKEEVKGVSAKVITVAMLGGDAYPTTPIGINLPNSNWIREKHGSKSVTIENVTEAYHQASLGSGFYEEFVWSETEIELLKKYKLMTDNLHVDMHECLGHGSGKLAPGVSPDALKSYGAPIEETRADLFGLYYLGDPKMVELGLLPNDEAYKAQYYSFFLNGLMTQTTRIEFGKTITQAHMRNRQLISKWVIEKSQDDKAIEVKVRDGKHFIVINDYQKIKERFGQLLHEIQRIKSTGDFEAAKEMVEKYAVNIDPDLHKEILERNSALNISPYRGFVNPKFEANMSANGNLQGLSIFYNENYAEQNLRYSKEYSTLIK